MVSPVITVGENDTVRDVAKLLIAKRISAVPVVDGAGKLGGILTEADLMRRVSGRPRHRRRLRQVPRGEGNGHHDTGRQDSGPRNTSP
jgi:CBS domain-containing protein